MKKWSVETLNDTVDEELSALPADMWVRFIWISELITGHGLERVKHPEVKLVLKRASEVSDD